VPGVRLAPSSPHAPMSNLLFDDLAPPAQSLSPVVVARKYRPRNFASVVGQDLVVKALQHALRTGRLHHAYLLTGARGVGKTTLARILAKALNCETGVTEEPCGQCGPCLEVDRGRFVDYLEIDAASNRGVDNIQEVLEQSRFAPTSGRTKVIVIDEVHMLSGYAFNAMLKTLEEPPEHVKFVLATTDPQKIPVTVLSRCMQFGLKPIAPAAIAARMAHILVEEGVEAEPAALDLLARHTDLRGLCVVGGGGDGIIRALAQQPGRPGLCSILPESTELSHQALKQGLISLVVDSQPKLIAAALMDLLVELQTAPQFDPLRHRIHVPLQIVTSENL